MAQEVANKNLHRIVGSCMIYDQEVRFLALKRRPDLKVYPGLWTVPAGGMDRDDYALLPQTSPDGWENPLEIAMRREIKEEAGVEVGALEPLGHFTFIRPDNIPVFGMRFAAPYLSGEVTIDPEDSTEFAWVSVEEVGNYDFLGRIAEEIREFSEKLKQR